MTRFDWSFLGVCIVFILTAIGAGWLWWLLLGWVGLIMYVFAVMFVAGMLRS